MSHTEKTHRPVCSKRLKGTRTSRRTDDNRSTNEELRRLCSELTFGTLWCGCGYDASDVAPKRRLRRDIADLFLASDISGQSARSLLEGAGDAGASGGVHLRNSGDDSRVHRMLRKSKSPRLHCARCRSANQFSKVSTILHHEMLSTFVQHAVRRPNFFGVGGMDLHTLKLFKKASDMKHGTVVCQAATSWKPCQLLVVEA